MFNKLSKREIINQMRNVYSSFLKENTNIHFKMPVLILVGENDKIGKVKRYCKMWEEREHYPLHIIKIQLTIPMEIIKNR